MRRDEDSLATLLLMSRLCADGLRPLVSGGARGVDQLAMEAASKAGGAVIGLIAESLLHKLKHPDVRRTIYGGDTVICTPYAPTAPFNVGNAMGRNKLIYAQAELTVVISSKAESGVTWSGAIQHWVGAMASKHILAINLDREANMVTKADWAVIADLHEVIPAVIAEINRRRGWVPVAGTTSPVPSPAVSQGIVRVPGHG